jgi:hypothetical protein
VRQGSVLSPISYNATMNKTINEVRGEHRKSDMFADDVLI